MPTPKTKPTQPAVEPKPEPESSTALLKRFLNFEHTAGSESCKLLGAILRVNDEAPHSFAVVAADVALASLGVNLGLDALDNPQFRALLNLFGRAVSGWGYGGFREQVIEALLMAEGDEHDKMGFEKTLRVLALEFEVYHSTLNMGKAALKEIPEQLADSIEKAIKDTPTLRERIAALYIKPAV